MPEIFDLDSASRTDDDWWYLDVARLFCRDKSCHNKDVCVDGNERVWVDCPAVAFYKGGDTVG
jgi:hypothetical protein